MKKKSENDILNKVPNFFKKEEKVILGVSGGVDSIVLLDILNKIGLKITVAHLNHGLRKEATKDEKFVKSLAKKYRNKFVAKKVKLPKSNIEEAGRKERYAFFKETLEKKEADSIVIAHNANDNVETIILNLARGAGIKGLSGMKSVEGSLKRPLLGISKDEILDYARKNKLAWREDKSNKDLKFSRNRIRNRVVPELEKINSNTLGNILRAGSNLSEIEEFIRSYVEEKYTESVKENEQKSSIDLKKLEKETDFIKKRVILKVINRFLDKNIAKIHLEDIINLLDKKGTKEIPLPLGLKVTKIYDNVEVGFKEEKTVTLKQKEVKKTVTFGEWTITATDEKKIGFANKFTVFLDKSGFKKVIVRNKVDGDYLFLKENSQKKKISDLFIDQKTPKKKRENYPIIVNENNEVLFVPGLRANNKFLARAGAKEILKLEVKHEK